MRFAIKDHLSESLPLAAALQTAGHEVGFDGNADVFLIDFDTPEFGYRDLIDIYKARGAIVLLYPHGTGPNTAYDSLFEPYPKVDGELTMGSGEPEFYRRLGIDRPTCEIGWSYCPQLPFRSCSEVRRVLFAPTHPNGDGTMLPHRKERNGRVFQELLDGPWQVTVRAIGSLEQNGLWEAPDVLYVRGAMDLSTAEIDVADVVVAGAGTFPVLAVSRGVPTVFYGQGESTHGKAGEEIVPLARLDLHRDVSLYPYDAGDLSLGELFPLVTTDDSGVREWRERWVGKPFDGPTAVRRIEHFVGELRDAERVAYEDSLSRTV